MGVLDFLSELAGANGKKALPDDTSNLNLGGIRSLLGVRDAAPTGARGDAMIQATTGDKLPGYFDSTSREYVPWYVDLFDGGGRRSARRSVVPDAVGVQLCLARSLTNTYSCTSCLHSLLVHQTHDGRRSR